MLHEDGNAERLILEGLAYFNSVDAPETDEVSARRLLWLGKESEVGVPILVEGEAWGEVYATTAPGQPRFRGEDVSFLETVAGQLAVAIGRAELFTRVSRLAYEDPLTGLANRRALEERLQRAVARAAERRIPARRAALRRRRAEGDQRPGRTRRRRPRAAAGRRGVVAAAAARPGNLVGRLSGDEFCVVMEGGTLSRHARSRARPSPTSTRRTAPHPDLLRRGRARARRRHAGRPDARRRRRPLPRQAQRRRPDLHRRVARDRGDAAVGAPRPAAHHPGARARRGQGDERALHRGPRPTRDRWSASRRSPPPSPRRSTRPRGRSPSRRRVAARSTPSDGRRARQAPQGTAHRPRQRGLRDRRVSGHARLLRPARAPSSPTWTTNRGPRRADPARAVGRAGVLGRGGRPRPDLAAGALRGHPHGAARGGPREADLLLRAAIPPRRRARARRCASAGRSRWG